MTNARTAVAAMLALTLSVMHAPLCAQDAATVAEGLFREGLELIRSGDTPSACQKFAESQRLDPSSGTLLNLADCHERQGKLATAWSEFLAAGRLARMQGRRDRAQEAMTRAAALQGKLSYLRIVLSEAVPGVSVKLDTVTLESSALGSKIPVDPGEHLVLISAPGHRQASLHVTIGTAGDLQTLTVPELEPEVAALAPVTLEPKPTLARVSLAPAPDELHAARGAPVLGYVIGGVGVASLGVGVGFALLANSAYGEAEKACPSRSNCSSDAINLRENAETRANIANLGIGLGIAGVGVGTFLLITSTANAQQPQRAQSRAVFELTPSLSRTSAGVVVEGVTF